ncbi:GGDEF domain-containing protein [Oceanisphaera avium]|uniref:diguanylate cyclase n=1 Tax=Oceanisphaera avium TaxID=1903694 RepID=A0A1Y0D1N6_9GAMM|nr:GGDEF domain-containing protein [Oceanisphaera avium]ART81015.1 hypothetical protein CBP12_13330 [Oceanisphaera avium]
MGGLLSFLTLRRNRRQQRAMHSTHQELLRLNSQLSHLADTDTLTQCPNRRAAYSRLGQELLQLRSYDQYFCVVLLDLDFFKAVNDRHGHDVGDQVLAYFSHTARNTLRASDFLARIGGEEFLLILPETRRAQALPLAQRLLDTIIANPLYLSDKTIPFTFSGGLIEAHKEDDIQHLLQRADRYLYAAKLRGRSQIIDDKAYDKPPSAELKEKQARKTNNNE